MEATTLEACTVFAKWRFETEFSIYCVPTLDSIRLGTFERMKLNTIDHLRRAINERDGLSYMLEFVQRYVHRCRSTVQAWADSAARHTAEI